MRVASCATRLVLTAIALLFANYAACATTTGYESTLYTFPSTGSRPSPIIQASDGNFYGTVNSDVNGYRYGYIFRLTPGGTFSVVYAFTGSEDGGNPTASLIEGNDGNLYGTNQGNGFNQSGVLFRLTPGGSFKVLHVFAATDGSNPGSLIQNKQGDFFGVALRGGSSTVGTVFKYSREGVFSVVHTFTAINGDGAFPNAPLLQASDGLIYGVTEAGGSVGDTGTIFRFDPGNSSTFKTLASFPFGIGGLEGARVYVHPQPTFGLTEGSDGLLYGMTTHGGVGTVVADPAGTIYSVTLGGVPTANFDAFGFLNPLYGGLPVSGLTVGGDGNLYGTTTYLGRWYDGTIFQFGGGSVTTLHSFTTTDGPRAFGAPIEGSDGNLYGVDGSEVYKLVLTPAIPPPITVVADAPVIALGQRVTVRWEVTNAFSKTAENCYAHGNWSGSKSLEGSETHTPTTAGTYTYALTCGGVESGLTTVTVHPIATTTTLKIEQSANLGIGAITLTAVVKADPGSGTPTGTVTFARPDGGPIATLPLDGSGKAVLKGLTPGAGLFSAVAAYNGAINFKSSVSPTVSAEVGPNTYLRGNTDFFTTGIGSHSVTISGSVLHIPADPLVVVNGATVTITGDAVGIRGTAPVLNGRFSTVVPAGDPVGNLPQGFYTLFLHYSGSGKFQPSDGIGTLVVLVKHGN